MPKINLKTLITLALCFVTAASAQISIADRFSANNITFKLMIPNTNTVLTAKTIYIDAITITNNTGSAVTFRVRDRSTDCNSAPCPIFADDVSIPAGTIWTLALPKIEATNGIQWSASSANALIGRIQGTY